VLCVLSLIHILKFKVWCWKSVVKLPKNRLFGSYYGGYIRRSDIF
jgi:hypothetical protein